MQEARGARSEQTTKQQQKLPENLYEPECIKSEARPGTSAQYRGSTPTRARATASANTAGDPNKEPRSPRLPRKKLEQKPKLETTQAILRLSRRKRRAQHQRLSKDKRNTGKDEEQADYPTSDTAERKRGQHHLHNWPPTVLPNVPSAKHNPNTSLHTGLCLLPKLLTSMAVITPRSSLRRATIGRRQA